jgi:hypothetical protein
MSLLKVPVGARALLARINRHLSARHRVLKKSRGHVATHELGSYYLVDIDQGSVVETDIALEPFARELGLMKDWEELDEPKVRANGE